MGEGCLRCSFLLSFSVLAVSPMYSSLQSKYFALVTVYYTTFIILGVPVLGLHNDLFDCSVAFKVNLYAILTTCLFDTFHYSFCIRDDYLSYCGLVFLSGYGCIVTLVVVGCITVVVVPMTLALVELLLLVSSQLLLNTFCCTLLMAQVG